MVWFHLPVSVPLAILVIRDGVQVREGDDVAAVRAQPLLVEAALPVLQLSLVLVGDADVGIVVFHTHPGYCWVVALQEFMVHLLVVLHKVDKPERDTIIKLCQCIEEDKEQRTREIDR